MAWTIFTGATCIGLDFLIDIALAIKGLKGADLFGALYNSTEPPRTAFLMYGFHMLLEGFGFYHTAWIFDMSLTFPKVMVRS